MNLIKCPVCGNIVPSTKKGVNYEPKQIGPDYRKLAEFLLVYSVLPTLIIIVLNLIIKRGF